MTTISFTVPMQAVPWQRAQHNGKQHFTARRSKLAKMTIQTYASMAMRGREKFTGPVGLEVLFVMKRASVCDCDNLQKQVQDALNAVVWKDDRQVYRWVGEKRACQTEDPFIEITVRSIGDA